MIDLVRPMVDLDVNWPEILVRAVLMPADQHASLGFDPVEPVVLVRIVGSDPTSMPRSGSIQLNQ